MLWKQLKCKLQVGASCDLETTLITAILSIQCGGQLPDQQHVREMRTKLRCMLQAVPLVDSNALFQNMMEMYMRKLTDARSIDSQESGAQELGASTWLQSRVSYAGLNTDA